MAFSQDDIAALERAIATGARRAKINGEEVEYRSLAEMRETLSMMRADLAGQVGTGGFVIGYANTGRGL